MEVEHIGQRGRWIQSPEVADMAGDIVSLPSGRYLVCVVVMVRV